ncbi:hypothetical protein BJP36_15495 [Moorena producens JHB]|uniref:Uncharacterized protein n=1 Tax=Moorena producens (strain JHB) TaxID=1454205 RepID=A0A1D9G0P1_MOOP1|nr:hypothetical protein [Moorena producens]AOY81094.1 hypothetical protein BJP36_15495 [Moorena producens JHB]
MHSELTCPSPRSGLKGWLDRFTGPGATQAELLIQFVPSLVALVAAPTYALTLPIQWSPLQLGLIAVLGLDLVGGLLTNATSTAKGWYHRPEQGWQQHLGFVSVHVIHVLLVALLFRGGDWGFFIGVSSYLLGASVLILRSPLYLQRPVALGLYGLGLLGDRYLFSPMPGLEWFLPLFFLKILVSHLLKETPYRPRETR